MTTFACGACGCPLSGDLRQVALPSPTAERSYDEPVPLLESGAFAVDARPAGHEQQVGTVVLHPGDVTGVAPHPDRSRLNGCCAFDGLDGRNLVCASCGAEVATRQDDCWVGWSTVRLDPTLTTASA